MLLITLFSVKRKRGIMGSGPADGEGGKSDNQFFLFICKVFSGSSRFAFQSRLVVFFLQMAGAEGIADDICLV